MNSAYRPSAELEELLGAMCEGELSAAQARRLETIVESDDDACWHYLCYVHLHGTLHWNLGEEERPDELPNSNRSATPFNAASTEESLPCVLPDAPISGFLGNTLHGTVGHFSSSWPVAYLVATVIVLVGMAIGAVMHVSQPVQIATQSAPLPSPLSSLPLIVGRITGMVDCQWADESTAAFSGASIPLGRKYALASGLMEITYDTGAKVILQGPATYEVESAFGGFLAAGKLTAKVEKKEERRTRNEEPSASRSSFLIPHSYFAVRTPTATVTDLGTEFGVEVGEQGTTSAYVFRGLVDVQPVSDGGEQRGQSVRLSANESAIVEKQPGSEDTVVRRIDVESPNFVRCSQLPAAAEEQRLKPFRRWQAHSLELRRDPSLLAYYDFQQEKGRPSVLRNVAVGGDVSLDGVVQQATWTDGRVAGKHALLFQSQGDYVQINLPRTVDDLTLAAWVNVTSLHQDMVGGVPLFNGLLMSEGWGRPGQVHWQIDSMGRVCLGQFRIQEGSEGRVWLSPPTFDQARLRRWTHIAAVLDRAARVRFYVNGQLNGEVAVEDQARIPICIGPARIGMWDSQPRTFNGRIDELAVFGRTLSSDEIRRMFEGGSPVGGKSMER